MKVARWNVRVLFGRNSKGGQGRYGLCAALLLGTLWAALPVSADEEQLPVEYRPFVQQLVDAAEARDHPALANQMKYPFKQEYPIPAIKTPAEMLTRFDEVFDDAILTSIASSQVGPGREHTNLKNEQPGQNASYAHKYHSYREVKLSAIYSPIGCFAIKRHICYLI